MANNDQVIDALTSVSNINDFLQYFRDDSIVSNCISSITYDVKSQTVIIRMQDLLKKETDEVEEKIKKREDEKIRELSKKYKEKCSALLDLFKEWEPIREELIKILRETSDKLDRNCAIVSSLRVLTSAADIFGTLARTGGKPANSWADFAMENSSMFGMLFIFLEMMISKKMHTDARKMAQRDQELFQKIIQWFEDIKKLDSDIERLFPFRIDEEIATKIGKSTSNFKDYNKIFMCIVASNVKQNVKLFTDKDFLETAYHLATSAAGKHWFEKIILKNDPCFSHSVNSELNEEIQKILSISRTENPELYTEGWRLLPSIVKMRVILNLMTIISAGTNLVLRNKSNELDVLEKLADKSKKELQEIRKVVHSLKSSESQDSA